MKIAIIKLSALGDIVHGMIVLQFLKQKFPKCEIDWICEECFSELLDKNEHVNNIYPINLKKIKKNKMAIFTEFKKLQKIRKNNYDFVIDMQGLLKSAICARIICKNVVGFDKNSIREKLASLFYSKKISSDYASNIILRNLALCSFNISHDEIINKKAFLFYDENFTCKDVSQSEKNILFVIGASTKNKKYPKENFIKIINKLNHNCLILWGNDEEKQDALYICKHTNAKTLPRLSLNELKALIAKMDLVIGGDTGPLHMAWGLNKPSICIFGNTPYQRNAYITPTNKTITSNLHVNAYKIDKNDFSIKNIIPEKIIDLVGQLL